MNADNTATLPQSMVQEEDGRTLWQICWNKDQEEPVVTMVDISQIDLRPNSGFRPHVSMDEASGDIVVFERNAAELEGKIKKGGSIYKQPYSPQNAEEGIDMSETSMVGWKFLVRSQSDSELDLIPPGSGSSEMGARARWCCISCRTLAFWRNYWWIPVLILVAVLAYVLVTLFIVNALLDAPL